jgi:hypothetical protein
MRVVNEPRKACRSGYRFVLALPDLGCRARGVQMNILVGIECTVIRELSPAILHSTYIALFIWRIWKSWNVVVIANLMK